MPIRTSHPMHRLSLAVMAFSLGITLDGAPQALAQGAALEEVVGALPVPGPSSEDPGSSPVDPAGSERADG